MLNPILNMLIKERMICRSTMEQIHHIKNTGDLFNHKKANELIDKYRNRYNELSIKIMKESA